MLEPDKTRVENGVTINEKIIPDSARANKYCASWCKAGEPMKPCRPLSYGVTGVTIHNTKDLPNVEDDGEQYTRATWPNCNMGGVVVHYYVDDLCAWQNLRENEAGWHATDGTGRGNYGTIAIEVIMDGPDGKRNAAAEANAAKLAASILHRHKLGIDRLYTHNHWMGLEDRIVPGAGKNCPVYILPHWDRFKASVKAQLDLLSGKGTSTPVKIAAGSKVQVQKGTVYGGLTSVRGKAVPAWVIGKTYTVQKIENHLGVEEALLAGILSWVAVDDLIAV